jgi:hypothetical protein
VEVAMQVAALQTAASVAMAAQRITAKQLAVLQVAALQMAAWWASLAVLAALVAVRQVRARSDRGDLAVGYRLIVSPGRSTELKAAKAVAVWVAKAKAVNAVTKAVTKAVNRG